VLSDLFYTQDPSTIRRFNTLVSNCDTISQPGLFSRLLPGTNTTQLNSTEFGGTRERAGTEESNLGNSVTISGSVFSPLQDQPSGTSEFEKNPNKNILFSGNFVSNLSSDESPAEISVRNNTKLTKYLCFKTISTMGSTLIKEETTKYTLHLQILTYFDY